MPRFHLNYLSPHPHSVFQWHSTSPPRVSVALNFQTPGTMMDVYDGRFRQNGCCGYVLKPAVMREPIGFFSPFTKDPVPGVTPQMLKVKVSAPDERTASWIRHAASC